MNSKVLIPLMAMVFALGMWNCEDLPPASTGGPLTAESGQVVGHVYDAQSRQPILSATVLLNSPIVTDSIRTPADGAYSFTVDLQGLPSLAASLTASKTGYRSRSSNVFFASGVLATQDIFLDRDTTTGVTRDSGTALAHSIALVNVATNQISVYGVGGTESSIITWEVRDSLGFPIDIDHRDTVAFSLIGTPVTGGAYISPAFALTNASGRVATIINSGTVSGVLQVVASLHRESDNYTVTSTPVLITVNAGLPDLNHFSVGPALFNFPGLDWINRTDQIIVQVGDKYTNPVKKNTAVYFSTTGGIIDASGFTDVAGHATVNVYSGAPRPSDAILGPGFAYITATTLGENGATISKSFPILFSGISQISAPVPGSFAVAAGGSSGDITFTVSDENGNPLAAGTTINVELQYVPPPNSQVNLTVTGNVNVILGDTQIRGAGTTDFRFRVVDQTVGGVPSRINATVVIKVTSPNGNPADRQLSGTIG